ncbi:putative transposase Ptta/En/Spm plant [Arabidopsis suecica]|uniref:Putative transposase Ptta/En/Spm plant n=1 Tax=Arabidopsis suecica TaxID=45249 RepID=A0A8T1YNE1_ARASU|nr:putative transposase Ptta/En/Spm plant [Arabidopsis suecica]
MPLKGKSSQGRGGGQNTRALAARGGQTSIREWGQTSRPVAAGGGETSIPVASRVQNFVGQRPPVTTSGVRASSHSSNPSTTQSAIQSHATRPLQYPSRHTPPLIQQTPPPQPQHHPQPPLLSVIVTGLTGTTGGCPERFPESLGGTLMGLTTAESWDIGITALVREGFLIIAKKRMKGIVSQVKKTSVQPTWIGNTLWAEMQHFWKTADAIERSENASQCRNSDRGGLKEEELGRLVSLGEVFMRMHTRADGSFVDQKSEQVDESYKKTIEERLAELEEEGQDTREISSEHSTHPRELNIDEMNDIFLMCTHTDDQGNPYGFGSLVETLHKGKSKEIYASSSSTVTVVELQDQLRRKISDQDAENARRDAEHRTSQAWIASLEKLILFMKEKDPDLAAFMSSSTLLQPTVIIPPSTQTDTLPTTT